MVSVLAALESAALLPTTVTPRRQKMELISATHQQLAQCAGNLIIHIEVFQT